MLVVSLSLYDDYLLTIVGLPSQRSAQKAYGKIKDKMGTLSKPKKRAR